MHPLFARNETPQRSDALETADDHRLKVDIVNSGVPIISDVEMILGSSWETLIDNVRIDDDPTFYNSAAFDVSIWSAVWVLIDIDSTLAPTNLRVVAQFSNDNGVTWWDFEEGLWASLYWEDVDTASGINKAFLLPCGGQDNMRIRVVGTGTDATNYFDVTVKMRGFRGNFGVAHA